MAGLLAIFAEFEREILRERVKAGIAHAREQGKPHGRPATVKKYTEEVRGLFNEGFNQSDIVLVVLLSEECSITNKTAILDNSLEGGLARKPRNFRSKVNYKYNGIIKINIGFKITISGKIS
jgi:DNA invertase Pin-like site-specific DNA recombinase